jgi:hypothetical protein
MASKLQEANSAIEQSFNAVLDAEKAGANITNQLTLLNSAASILTQAENSYRVGDKNIAEDNLDTLFSIVEQVTADAQTKREVASTSAQAKLWSTTIYTVIAVTVFVLALFLVWRVLKRSYVKNLSNTKPEVPINES